VGQLVVGHVEELGPAKQVTQPVPGGDVGRVVGGVAIGGPVADRHRPVTGDGEDPHQLLEVGPVILGVATHQSRGALAAAEAPGRGPVRPSEPDRGGVVVQLTGIHLEGLDDP
jgi:hypothetical protein